MKTNLRYSNICLRALALLCLMMASVGAWAQTGTTVANCYVFNNGTYGYLYNNNGTLASDRTFHASSVWIASAAMGQNNRTLQSYTNKAQYLVGSAGNGDAVSIGNSSNVWQTRDGYLATRGTYYSYYLQTANGTTFTTRRNNINERYTPTAITVTEYDPINETSGGLSSVGLSAANITYGGTAVTATLTSPALNKDQRVAYTQFSGITGGPYYWWDNADKNAAPNRTQGAVALTRYEWSLSGAGASYLSLTNATTTGLTNTITYTTPNPNADAVATVTVKAVYADGTEISKTATITARRYTADPTAINANNMELVVGGTQSVNPTLTCAIPSYSNIYTNLSYASNNTAVASVNATTGVVTANAKGTATITITARLQGGGSITKDISVSVAERAATPTITFNSTTGELTMSSTTPGAEIHYTLTGSDPTSGSTTYDPAHKPVLTEGATVKAITTADGYIASNVTTLTVEQVATPTVTVSGTTVNLACGTTGVTYYYTTDGSEPTLSSTNTTSTTLTTIPSGSTLKVMAVKNGLVNSEVSSKYIELSLATPTITISDGKVTMTSPDGATIHYTTDGSTPTASSPTYTTPLTATNGMTYKAIAVKDNFSDSEVAEEKYMIESGVSGGVVTLNDYEDHTWTYYAGVDSEVDGGNYNTNYVGKLYSPNPRNVKITYYGKGRVAKTDNVDGEYVDISNDNNYTVKVGINEPENTFVYYKTLERDGNSRYPYTTIPNPFSVRPVYGTNATTKWRGFYRWRIKTLTDGSIYAASTGGTPLAVGSYLEPDKEYYFQPSDYNNDNYTINGTSMTVELEAVWVRAYVNTTNSNTNFVSKINGGWERNFVVYTSGTGNTATGFANYPVTYTALYPNGTTNGTTAANAVPNVSVATNMSLSGDVKIENIRMNGGATLDANWNSLWVVRNTIGTGTNNLSAERVTGVNNTTTKDSPKYTLRVESGRYNYFDVIKGHNTDGSTGNTNYSISGTTTNARVFVGSDYDRANQDNSLLTVVNQLQMGCGGNFTNTGNCANEHTMDMFIKSGTVGSKYWIENTNTATQLQGGMGRGCYMGSSSTATNTGRRNVTVEGGDICAIGGGYEGANNRNYLVFNLRIMGGTVHGNIYGGASQSPAYGSRRFVFTGGRIMGWVAPGCNGTSSDGGQTNGESFAYIGGNTRVDSGTNTKKLGYACGGNVYAAGAGREGTSTCGEMTYGTNLVIADDCYIQRGAYGGGNYGYANVHTNIYITGGTNAGQTDTQAGNAKGGVFGGSNQQNGPEIKIWMTGGKMLGGVYGGCNTIGNITGNVTMQINGGQVGENATNTANIHGGGYGQSTIVTKDVDITLGKMGAARDADGVTVWGDVYGGSALGSVNGTAASNTKHTNVTMNAGYIHGSLYGGALGDAGTAANVYGPVQVKVYGGSVFNTDGTGANGSGAVYGANNINGAPQRSVTVDIYGTNSAPAEGEYALFSVYGGGNQANYTYGNGYPKVTVHNCDNSIEYVYGGGNAAAVAATDVTIYGGNKIGNVFGGGNGQVRAANVNGNTNVKIYGGTIGDVYGGSNTNGTIGGTISVTVNKTAEDGGDGCDMKIDNVYGGGNHAPSAAGSITIGCTGDAEEEGIGNVYGGANAANISSSITLNITGGKIDNVFGGNNADGVISGDVTVNITGGQITNVFGENNAGGNVAGKVTVNIDMNATDACGKASTLDYVYGGGQDASYTPTTPGDYPEVNLVKGVVNHDVFGGGLGESATVTSNPTVNMRPATKANFTVLGNIYGGGSAAPVVGSTSLTISNGTIGTIGSTSPEGGYVFGGGLGQTAVVSGDTRVQVTGSTDVEKNVYGGGNGGEVMGDTKVIIGE